jgi:hypothetical protein
LLVNVNQGKATVAQSGGSSYVILGSRVAQGAAGRYLKSVGGKFNSSHLRNAMLQARAVTPTVSEDGILLETCACSEDPGMLLRSAFHCDCEEMGWRA